MIEVDLHLHTTFSDGTLTPTQVVQLCGDRGLKVIAISDHDSTEGMPEALEAARPFPDLTVIPAIELSTDIPGSEIHILGYYVDYENSDLQRVLTRFRQGRHERARQMVEKLREVGVNISWERVQELADGAIGRPHIAHAMVEAGYVKYPREAFDRYIGRNGVAYADRLKLSPAQAVGILLENGALPVMAHPTYAASKSDRAGVACLKDTLEELQRAGLVGMEVHYGDYTPEQVSYLGAIADELGLIRCGGSDYHASGNPGEPEPGSVGPPMETVAALKSLWASRHPGNAAASTMKLPG